MRPSTQKALGGWGRGVALTCGNVSKGLPCPSTSGDFGTAKEWRPRRPPPSFAWHKFQVATHTVPAADEDGCQYGASDDEPGSQVVVHSQCGEY